MGKEFYDLTKERLIFMMKHIKDYQNKQEI